MSLACRLARTRRLIALRHLRAGRPRMALTDGRARPPRLTVLCARRLMRRAPI